MNPRKHTRADALTSRPLHPLQVVRALNEALPGNVHVFCDIGNTMAWAIHHLIRNEPYRWHVNLTMGSMGHALPGAIGAAIASEEPVVALVGDGAFKMSGFELHTAAELGVPVCAVVFNDRGHGMVQIGARAQWREGVPNYRFASKLTLTHFAESIGSNGYEIRSTRDLRRRLRSALRASGPTLLDVSIDENKVPPIGSRTDMLAKNFGGKDWAP